MLTECGERYVSIGKQIAVPEKDNKEGEILFDSLGKFYFSRLTDSGGVGLFNGFKLEDKYLDKELWVVFEGNARSNFPYSNGTITVIGSNDKNEDLCRIPAYLKYHLTGINKWCHFKDSIFLTSQLNFHVYNVINTFVTLGVSGKEKLDVDSLIVTVRQKVSNI